MSSRDQPARWDHLRQRLQEAMVATAGMTGQDQQRKREVYRQRAVRFATPDAPADSGHQQVPTLVFALGDQRLGFPVRHVAQIYPPRSLTPVPKSPTWVLGIASLDAQIRTVINLAELVNVPHDGIETGGNILLVRCDNGAVAVRVDRVEDVNDVDFEHLSAPDQPTNAATSPLVRGVTPEHLLVLSAEALVTQTTCPRSNFS